MFLHLLESLGRLFMKKPESPQATQPVAQLPLSVAQLPLPAAKTKLLAELKSPGGWDHRYACTDCKQHYDIMGWGDPCSNCGGYISPHQKTYKCIKGVSKWLTRDQVLEMIKNLEKGEPF